MTTNKNIIELLIVWSRMPCHEAELRGLVLPSPNMLTILTDVVVAVDVAQNQSY